jgi:fringe protein
MLKKNLTVIEKFHSHLEPMKYISPQSLSDQITFSYSKYGQEMNVVELDGINERADPTRFLSIHCKLFAGHAAYCPQKIA